MKTDLVFAWVQLTALACLVCVGLGHAIALYARGVHVFVVDRERTLAHGLMDLAAVAALLVWAYEIVAQAGFATGHVLPQRFDRVLVDAIAVRAAGVVVVCAGLLIHVRALRDLADSWRLGIDRAAPGALVTHGIYVWTRNPIYVALDLQVLGTFLVLGRLVFLVTALLLVPLLHAQIRREERFLAQRYGAAYRAYCARVGRYATWR